MPHNRRNHSFIFPTYTHILWISKDKRKFIWLTQYHHFSLDVLAELASNQKPIKQESELLNSSFSLKTTQKGKPCIILDGHRYKHRRDNLDGSMSWTCTQYVLKILSKSLFILYLFFSVNYAVLVYAHMVIVLYVVMMVIYMAEHYVLILNKNFYHV